MRPVFKSELISFSLSQFRSVLQDPSHPEKMFFFPRRAHFATRVAENIADLPHFTEGQEVIGTFEKPLKATGHIAVLIAPFFEIQRNFVKRHGR